jgi:hypothetical protein
MDNGLFNVDFSSMGDDSIEITPTGEEVNLQEDASQEEQSEKPQEGPINEGDFFEIDETGEELTNKEKDSSLEEELKDFIDADDAGETEETENSDSPTGEVDNSPVIPFASLLHQAGVLPSLNLEEFTSSEDKVKALQDAVRAEIENANNEFIKSAFPKELIDLAEAVKNGVPLDAIKENKIQELNYSRIDESSLEENTNLQKQLVKESLLNRGFKEAKADKLIEMYEDTDELFTESKDALDILKTYHKQQQENIIKQREAQQKALEENNKQMINTIQSTIDTTEEIIPGIKLNKTQREKTFNAMTQIVGQDQAGNPTNYIMDLRSKDPINFDMRLAYIAQLTDGFTDWSKVVKAGKSSAVKDFEEALKTNTSHKAGAPKKAGGKEINPLDGLKGLF